MFWRRSACIWGRLALPKWLRRSRCGPACALLGNKGEAGTGLACACFRGRQALPESGGEFGAVLPIAVSRTKPIIGVVRFRLFWFFAQHVWAPHAFFWAVSMGRDNGFWHMRECFRLSCAPSSSRCDASALEFKASRLGCRHYFFRCRCCGAPVMLAGIFDHLNACLQLVEYPSEHNWRIGFRV